ncbi:MAG TPA: zinc metallopeptidase [Gammaproteobacteria bacterium]|nr:zinc metallopeptidase [Gammaproteobacteria bacterium]
MHIVILIAAVIALVVGPGIWVNAVMKRYRFPANRYSRTGAETARELLLYSGINGVTIETTDTGDHYDPIEKAVRLTQTNHDGRSLTAVTIAAHEVGHAIQDAAGYRPLVMRTSLVRWLQPVEKLGAGLLMLSPLSVLVTRTPVVGLFTLLGGVLVLASGVLIHALTLPTEFDASFSRALPLLADSGTLRREDMGRARRLLLAAALTYVSAALQSLLSIGRWWAILRR